MASSIHHNAQILIIDAHLTTDQITLLSLGVFSSLVHSFCGFIGVFFRRTGNSDLTKIHFDNGFN